MASGNRKIGTCGYCGATAPLSADHVIPKCIFPDPLPPGQNFITIEACDQCNNVTKSQNDSFLRDAIVMCYWNEGNPLTLKLKDRLLRAAATNRSPLAVHAVNNNVTGQVITKDGAVHGTAKRILFQQSQVDQFNDTFITMARGLYQHRFGEQIPQNTVFDVRKYEKPDYERVISELGVSQTLSLGDGVFTWYCWRGPTPPAGTTQFLCFHGGLIAGVMCED